VRAANDAARITCVIDILDDYEPIAPGIRRLLADSNFSVLLDFDHLLETLVKYLRQFSEMLGSPVIRSGGL
jgi:hypothetical protein